MRTWADAQGVRLGFRSSALDAGEHRAAPSGRNLPLDALEVGSVETVLPAESSGCQIRMSLSCVWACAAVAAARKAIITALHGTAVLDITSSSVPKFKSAASAQIADHRQRPPLRPRTCLDPQAS